MALISGERGQTTPINLILQTDYRLQINKIVEMENDPAQTFYLQLVNPEESIGLRYQAVFQLKNINTPEAINKLISAYPHLSESVLLSHEVLYTLGQI